jgi:hypothetical protein
MRSIGSALLVLSLSIPNFVSAQVTGNGSSFARELINRWSESFGAIVGMDQRRALMLCQSKTLILV